ncbi:hypothetical protein JVU11DRAFT_7297 [Chiua virens]|nr:hypothetical protein JVU11DRAFT_7297 [Chiua virens]
MSHPLFFRGITYFYPTGNTSAVRLTEHLPPEQQANVLLLACGDPRHILYTVHTNDATNSDIEPPKLDVTCCDVESAVLARNALLFTLLADEDAQQRLDQIWNIFYHFVLDPDSFSLLVEQSRRLVTLAKDLESWNTGPYARFLTVCDKRTLAELHRCWSLYAATADYPADQRKWYQKSFFDGMKQVSDRFSDAYVFGSSRSAGPLLPLAVEVIARQFRRFWSTGVTDDEKFSVHYGTDPVAGFHLADVFATSGDETPAVLEQKVVRVARSEFSQWCTSVNKLLSATAMPSKLVAFSHLNSHGVTATPISTSPWKASRIEFEESLYGEGASDPAPTTFNVIDTSNLSDHVGLLNLLMVTAPILFKSPSATLYTESLLSNGDSASTVMLERLCGDLQTMSASLGGRPIYFPIAIHDPLEFAWKAINSEHLISFVPDQLGQLLFDVYLKMFSDENMARQLRNMSVSSPRAFLEQSLVHYTRRSFVQFLYHIKSRVQTEWTVVMNEFDDLVAQDRSLILGSNFYQEMCGHLHLLNIVTFSSMEPSYIQQLRVQTKSALFKEWESIPPVVTIVLSVPRSKMTAVESQLRQAGTPVLLCEIRNMNLWNMCADICAVYGRLDTTGTGHQKRATIVEDKARRVDVLSTDCLGANVGFRTRPSPRSHSSIEAIFTAPLEESRNVHILAEPPFPPGTRTTVNDARVYEVQEGTPTFTAQMNVTCTEIGSFLALVDITDPAGQASLAAGAVVKVEQTLNHGVRVCIDEYAKTIRFPLPVDVANTKLRVAHQSKYIELNAPLAMSMRNQNEDITKRFFTMLDGGVPTSLNVHRVNLDHLPQLNASKNQGVSKWLVPHVSLMFSDRERAVRGMASGKDTLVNLKDSLHTLLLSVAGVEGQAHTVFALQNASTGQLFAFIFVSDLRLDLGSHTVVADAWVAPATTAVQDKLSRLKVLDVLAIKLDAAEAEAVAVSVTTVRRTVPKLEAPTLVCVRGARLSAAVPRCGG